MSLPAFPALRLADITDGELSVLADWLAESAATVTAEQERRAAVRERVRVTALWKIAAAGPDDPRWIPQAWDGARIAAGPDIGRQGFIVGRCGCGCEQVDGLARWELYIAGGGPVITCIPRAHLRPAPTVRREAGLGRVRCDYDCLCCIGDPRRCLTAPITNHLTNGDTA